MTKERAKDIFLLPDFAQRAFDAFIGFIYATSIGLVVRTAYTKSKFDDLAPIALTLLLLAFFAQDWMARFLGRQRMSGEQPKKVTLYYYKLLIEITIVYFLLLVSLRLVELYSPLVFVRCIQSLPGSAWSTLKTPISVTPDPEVCYIIAAFAFFSGVWNLVMMDISPQVNKKQIWSFIKGHLDDEIVNVFPVFRKWQNELRGKEKSIHERVGEESKRFAEKIANGSSMDSETVSVHLKNIRKLHHTLSWVYLKFLAKKGLRLTTPYLLTIHIVALNLTLGILILISTCSYRGESIFRGVFGMQPFRSVDAVSLVFAVLLVSLLAGSLLSLGIHFKSDRRKVLPERLGCWSLEVTILLIYSISPVFLLIIFAACQQITVNRFMIRHFEPPVKAPNPVAHEHEMVKQGGRP